MSVNLHDLQTFYCLCKYSYKENGIKGSAPIPLKKSTFISHIITLRCCLTYERLLIWLDFELPRRGGETCDQKVNCTKTQNNWVLRFITSLETLLHSVNGSGSFTPWESGMEAEYWILNIEFRLVWIFENLVWIWINVLEWWIFIFLENSLIRYASLFSTDVLLAGPSSEPAFLG